MNIQSINQATSLAVNAGAKFLHIHQFGEDVEAHVKQLLEWADFPLNAHVYDMGSGLGELTRKMSEYRHDIKFHLINLSDEQIHLTPGTVKLDFTNTNLPKNSIDAAMYVFSIGHANHDIALKEASEIIKPNGVLFIYDMIGDDQVMKQRADYSLLTNDEMQSLALKHGFMPTTFLVPEDYDISEARSIIGEHDFDVTFGNVKPAIWRFVKC